MITAASQEIIIRPFRSLAVELLTITLRYVLTTKHQNSSALYSNVVSRTLQHITLLQRKIRWQLRQNGSWDGRAGRQPGAKKQQFFERFKELDQNGTYRHGVGPTDTEINQLTPSA